MASLNDKGKFKKKMFFIDFIEHVFFYIAYKQEGGGVCENECYHP